MVRTALLTLAAVALSGCISLFPKAEPASTYKLTVTLPETATPPGTGAVILRAPTAFTRLGASDKILTIVGSETATIAGARWAAPASVMFDEALVSAFDATSARMVTRGDIAPADMVLRVEVRSFEARYLQGSGSAPTVVVEARASLTNLRDRTASGTRAFRASQLASDNRVSAIVDAYNAATSQVVTEIARWTESQAPAR